MPPAPVFEIEGVVRRYDWGSCDAIQRMLGEEPDGRPAAELWFGAHPDDPSPAPDHGRALDDLIAADPVNLLGADVVEQFGPRLPYLVKVLAARTTLSIQVHPGLEQARAGYAAEDAAGVPRDATNRSYRDENHKPELMCALSPFEALCGFRPVRETLALLEELAVPELRFVADALRGPDPLRTAFEAVLTLEEPAPVVAALLANADETGPLRPAWLAAQEYPDDVGVVLSLLLNYVRLEPGEAIYLGAGNVHAYLRGLGVEIMANSDNVLRCGLTSKHVDVAELLRIADFTELTEPRWPAESDGYVLPVPDFRVCPVQVAGRRTVDLAGPRIVLCVDGAVDVAGAAVRPGHAVFVPAGIPCGIDGAGHVFVAAVGSQ